MTRAARRIFDRLRDPYLSRWTPQPGWRDSALEHLLGTYDVGAEIHTRTAARLRHVEQLTAEQSKTLDLVRQIRRFEVTGPAGTGKTWMAMEQARRWAAAGERVALLAYTRGVVEAMRRALSDLPPTEQPAWVGTYFQLAAAWGIRAGAGADDDFWTRRGPAEMLEHAATLPTDASFTALVVDEAQDVADSWWPALLAASTADARIAVFRDDEQTVFAQRRGRPEVDLVPLALRENLRNAAQIIETFRPLISTDVVCRSGTGFPLEYVRCTTDSVVEMTDRVVAELVDLRGWLPEHVVVLSTCHRHPVQREFDDKDLYWNDLWDANDVFYSTVAGFKGLERPAVVLMVDGFHDEVDPRHVLYTGMSRARDLLVVVAPPELIDDVATPTLAKRLRRHERTPAQ